MTNIAMPIWLLIVLTALPSLCLLGLTISLLRNRKKENDSGSNQPEMTTVIGSSLKNSFQNDLNALQIDTVFNAIAALIETERIKLKNLLCAQVPYQSDPPIEMPESDTPVNGDDTQEWGISHQIGERAASGESIEAIAKSLGISRNEVELAMSIHSKSDNGRGGRLEAVA